MKIKKIKVKNIRSYESQEMEFPEGSILLSGEIGSGKTSILLAIEYALFGLQPGQKGTALLRNNTNYGEVYLEVIIDGRKIVIERKLRKTSKGVSNEYAAIIIDGEKIESSLTEIKSKIIELLGYPKEFVKKNNLLYRYTVYAQQENMKQIIFEDAETRLNILRHIFGVDKYKQIKNNLSIFLNYLKGHVKLLQGEISDLEDEKEELNSTNGKIALTEEKINLETQELYNKTRNRKLIEQELKKTERKIQEKRSLIEEINKIDIVRSMKKESLDSLREEIIEEEKVLRNNADNFNEKTYSDILESLKDKKFEEEALRVNYLDIVNRINSLRVDLEDILSKKERIFRIDICPTCLQNVSDVYKHNIVNEVEKKSSSIRSMIEKLEGDKLFLSERINVKINEIQKVEEEKCRQEELRLQLEKIYVSRRKILSLENRGKNMESEISVLSEELKKLEKSSAQYFLFEEKFLKINEELKRAFIEEKNSEITLAELKKEQEMFSKQVWYLENNIKRKEDVKRNLKEYNELIDWLSSKFLRLIETIEKSVLIKLRGEFSNLFRKWFTMLVSDYSLDSQIDENFTPIIIQNETEMEYDFLSGGERTAVALAYRLALNQTINSMLSKLKTKGLIILDEPTEGFSEAQINKIRDIFEELDSEQLLIVSHEQKIEGFVDNVLKVNKEGNVSRIAVV